MHIGGKEYKFRSPVLSLLRAVAKVDKPVDWEKALTDDEEFEKVKTQWEEFCGLIFEKADDGLDVEKLTLQQMGDIRKGFFDGQVKTPPKP